jgi:hypothetical protein
VIGQVELGIHGIKVGLGDHVCGLYAGTWQRDELVIAFLEAGLRRATSASALSMGSNRPRS